jgi:hypothetical protein
MVLLGLSACGTVPGAPVESAPVATTPPVEPAPPPPPVVAPPVPISPPDVSQPPFGPGTWTPPAPSCVTEYACEPESAGDVADPAPAPYGHCHASRPAGAALVQPFYQAARGTPPGKNPPPAKVEFDPDETANVRDRDAPNPMVDACCYTWTGGCMGGRPYAGGEGPIVGRDDFAIAVRARGPGDAAAWAALGAAEHASIAAFNALSLQLLALGAPLELVRGAQRAAADEVEHAALCFGVATALGGEPVGPGPLPIAPIGAADLREVAISALLDGCVAEGTSALLAHDAGERADDPAIRAVLRRVAHDEQRHAELAWRVVAWALACDASLGAELVTALAVAAAPPAGGVLGTAAQIVNARAGCIREVVAPCLRGLTDRGRGARPRACRPG